ncbi:unnamed protein product [Colletotrichum noveboracense]|uniref:Uncharacterized protein n=1 Tax=Colletotrichum noveboracense TaxID=2664923 RepID=A0A9W4W8P1_9PEZI|nr:unnamed protein product [Colletotrichum noveboracense]
MGSRLLAPNVPLEIHRHSRLSPRDGGVSSHFPILYPLAVVQRAAGIQQLSCQASNALLCFTSLCLAHYSLFGGGKDTRADGNIRYEHNVNAPLSTIEGPPQQPTALLNLFNPPITTTTPYSTDSGFYHTAASHVFPSLDVRPRLGSK